MKPSVVCRGLLAGSLLVMAATASAGIADTKHNLGSTHTATGGNSVDSTDEICVFCHTPHGANTSANPPLWNRKLAAPTTYTTYASLNSATLDAEVANVGSVSIACLSCHDGTQAMNVMINAPGSGNYDPNGFDLGGTWTGLAGGASPTGSLNYAPGSESVVNIGQDLKNDHPIGIQYGGGGVDEDNTTAATTDTDFKAVQHGSTLTPGGGTNHYWWVDTGGTGRQKTDMILYTRSDFTGGKQQPSVECASCHDPHSSNDTFLRLTTGNAESAVCLACHTK
jgi:predicted CXXCH cytochrome family protein